MVTHPAEYPWSSYRCNALGDENLLVTPHALFNALSSDKLKRQVAYQALFDTHIERKTLDKIREATNKAWVLGDDQLQEKIARLLDRPTAPKPKGGDHCSKKFRETSQVKRQ